MEKIQKDEGEEDRQHRRAGTIFVLISAASFGIMGVFARYAYQSEVNVISLASLRFLIAAAIMWLLLLIRGENPRVGGKQLLALATLGTLGFAVMAIFYFNAVKLIPVSVTAIIVYTHPAIVTVLSAWLCDEPITANKAVSLLISFAGLVLVVGIVFDGISFTGIMYAMGDALVSALYIVLSNKLVGKIGPLIITTYIISSAAVALTLFGWVSGSLDFSFSPEGWLPVLGIAVISTVVAILAFFKGMKIIGPSRTAIISTFEPVITVLLTFLILSEKLTIFQLIGACMVISVVFLIQKDPGKCP